MSSSNGQDVDTNVDGDKLLLSETAKYVTVSLDAGSGGRCGWCRIL